MEFADDTILVFSGGTVGQRNSRLGVELWVFEGSYFTRMEGSLGNALVRYAGYAATEQKSTGVVHSDKAGRSRGAAIADVCGGRALNQQPGGNSSRV